MSIVSSALLADTRYALRSLLRSPFLTLVAVATLALGSGAATTTLAVVDSVLIEALGYPDADEVVAVWHNAPGAPFPLEAGGLLASGSMWLTYASENRVFEDIGLWTPGVATVTGDGEPEEVPRVAVTLGVLEALRVPPLLGRWFDAEDVERSGQSVMLSYAYWQRRFGGDPAVVGRTLTLNGNTQPADIIGVMPQGFRIADQEADLYLGPMRFERSSLTLAPFAFYGIARLKRDKTVADANADLERMLPIWLDSWPADENLENFTDMRIAAAVRPLKQDVVGRIGEMLWLVMAAIGVVLAIACANVANLMLIRGAARRHEFAIRSALGAGASRLRRALCLEGGALGLVSGVVGVAAAAAGLRALLALAPANLPRLSEIALDAKVVAAGLAVSSLAGLIVGVVAATRACGEQLNAGLHAGGRTLSGAREQHRTQHVLVVAQVALAVVVLVCAGLAIRTVKSLSAVSPGFTGAEQVQTFRISMRVGQVPEPELVVRRQQAIVDAIAHLPGVEAVGFGSSMPMDQFNLIGGAIEVEGRPEAPGDTRADVRRFKNISPDYFAAVGIALVAGRDFLWSDLYERRPVVLVSEDMARELWASPSAALGKRLRMRDDAQWREVIGVVGDVREDGLREHPPAIVYWPSLRVDVSAETNTAFPPSVSRSVVIAARSRLAGTAALHAQVERAVWSVDPNLPLIWFRTLSDIYEQSMARTTFTLVVLAIAGGGSLVLGVVGLHGVLSYAVALRRREIAIRLALGEQHGEVLRRFVRHGVVLAAFGVVIGLMVAGGVTRLLTATLYGVTPFDPSTYGVVALCLIAVAAVASYVPARRASAVDPAESLAAE